MRIAHVSDCYLPRTGGIESQVRALARAQAGAGDQVRVITATPGHQGVPTRSQILDGEEIDGIYVHRVAMRLPFDLPIHLRTRAHVGDLLTANAVDVVHVHTGVISPFAWGALRATHELSIPTLITVHSMWGPLARPAFRATYEIGRLSRWGMQVSAVSRNAADLIAATVPDVGEVLVVPNGIDPSQWQVERPPRDDSELKVVTVMRLAPRKRIIALLRVIDQARRSDRRISLTVIGDGPVRSRAEKFTRDHGLSGAVTFTGRLDAGDIKIVFANSDVFIQPSIKESFGLAALEARSAGLPVVARAGTGTTEFITDGKEGLIAADDAGLTTALIRLARDRELLGALVAHNLATPPAQTWPAVLEQVRLGYLAAAVRNGN
ncbi:MAG: glycosyltransferase family 4 protein [Actinomycetota bacterium]|nr:glycosyltransferase family 4 protein [Actinomycetota bacterium]